jgi:hypothetical protein
MITLFLRNTLSVAVSSVTAYMSPGTTLSTVHRAVDTGLVLFLATLL